MVDKLGPPISRCESVPEHVAAYAAGIQHCSGAAWPTVAAVLEGAGMGHFVPATLAAAADAWVAAHIEPAALALLRPRARRRGRRR